MNRLKRIRDRGRVTPPGHPNGRTDGHLRRSGLRRRVREPLSVGRDRRFDFVESRVEQQPSFLVTGDRAR